MKNLRELQRYVQIQHRDDRDAEVREFMTENTELVAALLGVPVMAITNAIATVPGDAALAVKLLNTIKSKIEMAREERKDAKVSTAQASANALGSVSFWEGDCAQFDLQSLLASCLTNPKELLVFESPDGFQVVISMAPLLKLAALDRGDMSAYVDRHGVHVRWSPKGALNFVHQLHPEPAARVVFPLPARMACAAE